MKLALRFDATLQEGQLSQSFGSFLNSWSFLNSSLRAR